MMEGNRRRDSLEAGVCGALAGAPDGKTRRYRLERRGNGKELGGSEDVQMI